MFKLAVASDHAGVTFKNEVLFHLRKKNYITIDLGPHSANESVDYPDYAEKIVERIKDGTVDAGIAICGTGIGMSIAANKFHGIRAVCPWDRFPAKCLGDIITVICSALVLELLTKSLVFLSSILGLILPLMAVATKTDWIRSLPSKRTNRTNLKNCAIIVLLMLSMNTL